MSHFSRERIHLRLSFLYSSSLTRHTNVSPFIGSDCGYWLAVEKQEAYEKDQTVASLAETLST